MTFGNQGMTIVLVALGGVIAVAARPVGWWISIIGVTFLLILMAYGDIRPGSYDRWVERAAVSSVIALCVTLILAEVIQQIQFNWLTTVNIRLEIVWVISAILVHVVILDFRPKSGYPDS